MIRINLLPVRSTKRHEAVKRELAWGGIGVGVLGVLLAGVFFMTSSSVNAAQSTNKRLERDLANLDAVIAAVDTLEQQNEDLRTKLGVIEGLRKDKTGPVHLMAEVSNAIPDKASLTLLKEEDRKLTLQGLAAANEVISQFLINLEKSDWLTEVYLISIDQDEIEGFNLKTFVISAQLTVPGAEEVAADDADKKGKKGKKGKSGKAGARG